MPVPEVEMPQRAVRPNRGVRREYRPVLLERPSMARFICLSVLCHIWVVALFGDASGGKRAGGGWQGSFSAVLVTGRGEEGASNVRRAVDRRRGPSASALPPAVVTASEPQSVPSTPDQSIAAEPVVAAAAPTPAAPVPAPVPASAPAVVAPIAIEAIPLLATPSPVTPTAFSVAPVTIAPLANVDKAPQAKLAEIAPLPAPVVRPNEAGFAVYVPPIAVLPKPDRSNAAAPPVAVPTLPPLVRRAAESTLETYAPPPVVRPLPELAPVAERPQVAAPSVTPAAISPQAVSIPTPDVPLPPAVPAAPIVPRYAAPPIDPIRVAPSTNAPERFQPPPVERVPAQAVTGASSAPTATPDPMPSASRATGTTGTAAPSSTSSSTTDAARRSDAPAAGPSALFNLPVAPPPVAAPRLDLDQLRRQAREAARDGPKDGSGPRTMLPFPTVSKEASKRDMEKIFDKALKRPDCKEAYADLGLAAVLPLVRDTLKNDGCKW